MNKSEFEKGLQSAQKTFGAFGRVLRGTGLAIAGVGAAGAAGLGFLVKQFTDMGTEMQEASNQLGVSVENLSRLKAVGEQAGVPFEDLEKALFKLQTTAGKGEAAQALNELGVSIGDIEGKGSTEALTVIVDALAKVKDQSTAAAVATELFGKGGRKLVQMARDVKGGMGEALAKADRLGLTMSGQDAKAAKEFGDSLKQLEGMAKMAAFQLGGALVSELMKYKGVAFEAAAGVGAFVREHKSVILVVAAGVGALVAAGGAMMALGMAASGVASGLGVLAMVGGFLVSWPGLILAAGAALVYLWSRTDDGKAAVNGLAADWRAAFGDMVAAIKAGDFEGAFADICDGIQITWITMWANLRKEFDKFVAYVSPSSKGKDGSTTGALERHLANTATGLEAIWNHVKSDFARLTEGMSVEESKAYRARLNSKTFAEGNAVLAELEHMKSEPGFSDDAKLNELRKRVADRQAERRNRPERIGMPHDLGEQVRHAAMTGVAEATKGFSDPSALRGALGFGDKVMDRIAIATEAASAKLDKLDDVLAALRNPQGGAQWA